METTGTFERWATDVVEPVRRYLARRTDPATADDVLADVLLVCWRRRSEIPENGLPWAYRVARHCLANAERGARRQHRLAAKVATLDPPPQVIAPEPDGDERVHAALALLRPEEAELLRLWAWEQLGAAAIAEVLEITPNAVSIRLHRARGKFEDAWRKIAADGGHEEAEEGSRP